MTWDEAVAEQAKLYENGQFFTIHQEHDSIGTYYLMPASRRQVEEDMGGRV